MLEQPNRLDVYGWCADRTACGLLRVELPLLALRTRGLRTAFSGEALPDLAPRVLIGQRVCMPNPAETWQRLAASRGRDVRLIAEADDDLLEVDPSSPAYPFYGSPEVRARLQDWLRVADAVTVTTEPLAEAMRRYTAAEVHVVPNYLPEWLLQHERPRRVDGGLTIGWGGSNTHRMDWAECADQVRRFFARARPDVELHLMGAAHEDCARHGHAAVCDCPCHQLRLPEGRTRYSPWTSSVPDYWRAIDYDVMLCPLRPHQFNRSKSNLRVLEAAMLGIPVVASEYGPYAQFVQHGVTGLLVRRDHEWAQHLRALVEDEAMREEMGGAARRQAAAWTLEGHVDEWAKVLAP
jgi:glycosyltransferase involved in cell wall biosynthesis